MNYGICNLRIVPVRILDSDKSEMINQLIYGDIIEVLEEKNKWIYDKNKWVKWEKWKNLYKKYMNLIWLNVLIC